MDLFSIREAEIFEALKKLKGTDFVVVGGYAVSVYTLPRFSVDCDLVVKEVKTAERIAAILKMRGFYATTDSMLEGNYGGSFMRLEKTMENAYKTSFDLLVGAIYDRRTRSAFSADWVFKNSRKKKLRGKTFPGSVVAKVIDENALVALKLTSSKITDLRDVFMLLPYVDDTGFIKKSVGERTNLKDALKRASSVVLAAEFKKNLEGVYGFLDERTFQKHIEAVREFVKETG